MSINEQEHQPDQLSEQLQDGKQQEIPGCVAMDSFESLAQANIGYLMRTVIAQLRVAIEQRIHDHGITHAQWMPLFKLASTKSATVADLARRCDLDAGSMTRLLDRLEAKQLCRRVRSESDRRVVNVEITPQGAEVCAPIPSILSEVNEQVLEGFSEEEREQLKAFLKRLLTNAAALNVGQKATENSNEQDN